MHGCHERLTVLSVQCARNCLYSSTPAFCVGGAFELCGNCSVAQVLGLPLMLSVEEHSRLGWQQLSYTATVVHALGLSQMASISHSRLGVAAIACTASVVWRKPWIVTDAIHMHQSLVV